jgi:hypothetical protein
MPGDHELGHQRESSYCCNAPRGFGPNKNLPKCRRCRARRYCSDACQRADWPVHAAECVLPAAAADQTV